MPRSDVEGTIKLMFSNRYYTKKNQVKQYRIRLRRRQRRPDGGDPVKLFDVKGIDISEEIDQRSKMSLSLMVRTKLLNKEWTLRGTA